MDVMQNPIRQLALKFSILGHEDRNWILSRLSNEERAVLEELRQGLDQSGLLESPDVVQSLLDQGYTQTIASPAVDQLRQVAQTENLIWFFLLSDESSPQAKVIVSDLSESQQAQLVVFTRHFKDKPAPHALQNALNRYFSDGVRANV